MGEVCGEWTSYDRFVNLYPPQITHCLPINRHHTKYPGHREICNFEEKKMMETATRDEIYAKQAYEQHAVETLRRWDALWPEGSGKLLGGVWEE